MKVDKKVTVTMTLETDDVRVLSNVCELTRRCLLRSAAPAAACVAHDYSPTELKEVQEFLGKVFDASN